MSKKLGTVLYGSEHSADEVFLGRDFSSGKNYSEKTASEIDDEIREIISECYEICKKHLTEHIDKLHFVAEFLFKKESMDEEQFRAAMESDNPTIEYIEEIAAEKKRKSEEENKTAHENNEKAEEEARKKAEEEAAKRIAEMQKTGKFPVDDFFNSVFTVPKEKEESISQEDEVDNSQENSDATTDSDSEKDENNE
jgi:cell division protease FtsH